MRLTGEIDVVGVTAVAADEDRILGASDRLTDSELGHGQCGFRRPLIHVGCFRLRAES
jgi:hypothetical protein